MTLQTLELDKKMQEYSISEFRNYPEYVKICEAFCVGLYSIQNVINYLSDVQNVDRAEGIWLDYLGWLVGTTRSTYDILQYFCVNAEHINVEKLFYFEGASDGGQGSLLDIYFRKKIRAKVAYNTSKTTRNENIRIIEGMVNADKVKINNVKAFDNFTEVGTVNITDGITPTIRLTTAGSPVVNNDGIASGFSNSNYFTKTLNFSNANSWEVHLKLKTAPSTASTGRVIAGTSTSNDNITIQDNPGENRLNLGLTINSTTLLNLNFNFITTTPDTWYYIIYSYSNGHYYVKYSTDGVNYTTRNDITSSQVWSGEAVHNIGRGPVNNQYFNGSIDLKQLSITVDGQEVYRAWEIEEEGIASGFSGSNYLRMPAIALGTSYTIQMQVKTTDIESRLQPLYQISSTNRIFISTNGAITIFANTGNTSYSRNFLTNHPLTTNINYLLTISSTNGYDITVKAKNIGTGVEYSDTQTMPDKIIDTSQVVTIGSDASKYVSGSIDLNAFKIIVDGKTVYRPWRIEPMMLDVDIYGDNLYYPSTASLRETIETVIGNGVGLRYLDIKSSDTI